MSVLARWREFRYAQREALRASNQPREVEAEAPSTTDPLADALPGLRIPDQQVEPSTDDSDTDVDGSARQVGCATARSVAPSTASPPSSWGSSALGVLTALLLWQTLGRLATTITLLVVAFFLTLRQPPRGVPDPSGRQASGRGRPRLRRRRGGLHADRTARRAPGGAAGCRARGQTTDTSPRSSTSPSSGTWTGTTRSSTRSRRSSTSASPTATSSAKSAGGVLGVGAAVIGGIFQVFTVLVADLVPALLAAARQAGRVRDRPGLRRRPRVISLSEEIIAAVGSYAIGQVAIATINAACRGS